MADEIQKFREPTWGAPAQINPAERMAAEPGVPPGWPMQAAWPERRWYFFNAGWVDLDRIDAACAGWNGHLPHRSSSHPHSTLGEGAITARTGPLGWAYGFGSGRHVLTGNTWPDATAYPTKNQ